MFGQQSYAPWMNAQWHKQEPPPKPNRFPLTAESLITYMDYLFVRNDVSMEERWELQAMYNVAIKYNQIWAAQVLEVSSKLEATCAHITGINGAAWLSAQYRQGLVDLYELVYSPVVEPWPVWSGLTDRIDRESSDMFPEEYDSLVSIIKLHGIEIVNCRRVLDGQPPLPNPMAKTTATYEKLYEEITKAFAEHDATAFAYLRKKVQIAGGLNLIPLRQWNALKNRLHGGSPNSITLLDLS